MGKSLFIANYKSLRFFNELIYLVDKKIRLIICAFFLVIITIFSSIKYIEIYEKISNFSSIIDFSEAFSTGIIRPKTEYIVIHHIAIKNRKCK